MTDKITLELTIEELEELMNGLAAWDHEFGDGSFLSDPRSLFCRLKKIREAYTTGTEVKR